MDTELGTITQEEALDAVTKYKSDELLELIKQAIILKRKEEADIKEDENQLKLNLDILDSESK